MNKVQYIELLKLRGIGGLDNGQSIADSVEQSGGEPSLAEMVKVNKVMTLQKKNMKKNIEY